MKAIEGLARRGLADENLQPEVFGSPAVVEPRAALAELGGRLGMTDPPRTIEGADIAHLAGAETVGSIVTFIDGKPFKNGYRRFKIVSHDRNDDYASMREIVWRRYRYAGMDESLFPDIILIDGGKGQLAAALSAFDELEFRPPALLSLAKKEELIYVHGRDKPLRLNRNDPALRRCSWTNPRGPSGQMPRSRVGASGAGSARQAPILRRMRCRCTSRRPHNSAPRTAV